MANRTPREKLPKEQKSKPFSFRLDPKNVDDAWVIDAIDFYAKQGIDLKTLFKDLLANAEGKPVGSVKVKARDIADMIHTIRELREMLESGQFTVGSANEGKSKTRRAKQKEIEYTDSMRSTFDKFVNRGFSADELEGDDE